MITVNKKVVRLGFFLVFVNIFGLIAVHHQLTQKVPSMLATSEDTPSIVETIQEDLSSFIAE